MAERRATRGAVTVEAAIAVCTLVIVLTAALGAILATAAHLGAWTPPGGSAARRTRRSRAGRPIAAQLAPRDAAVSIAVHGDEVRVEVSSPLLGGAGTSMPRLSATAVAVLEPGVGEAPPGRATGRSPLRRRAPAPAPDAPDAAPRAAVRRPADDGASPPLQRSAPLPG